MGATEWNSSISVLDRITAIFDAFRVDDQALSISELTRRTEFPKSTVSRIVSDLTERGYLERDGKAIRLGLRLFELGQISGEPRELRSIALPVMSDLRDATGETVHFGVLDGSEIVYLAILRGPNSVTLPSRVGGRLPAHATGVGKAILAHSSPELQKKVLEAGLPKLTENTITDPLVLQRELTAVRETGLAFESEESAAGLACVASPILTSAQSPRAAISTSTRVTGLDVERLGPAVRTAALVLTRRLAGRHYRG